MPPERGPIDPFSRAGTKTYGLLGIVHGRGPIVEAEPEHEVMAWPHLLMLELVVSLGVLAVFGVLALVFNAPLEELADPSDPPNPAKAPWYFLGLQELVSYSAFVGGVLTPLLVIFGLLMAIPYIDRDQRDVGIWFGGRTGTRLAAVTALVTLLAVPALIFLNGALGIRQRYPDAPQVLVDVVNPATALIAGIVAASLVTGARTRSWRLAAIVVFTGFAVAEIVLTIIGTLFRGPNWGWVWPWLTFGHVEALIPFCGARRDVSGAVWDRRVSRRRPRVEGLPAAVLRAGVRAGTERPRESLHPQHAASDPADRGGRARRRGPVHDLPPGS